MFYRPKDSLLRARYLGLCGVFAFYALGCAMSSSAPKIKVSLGISKSSSGASSLINSSQNYIVMATPSAMPSLEASPNPYSAQKNPNIVTGPGGMPSPVPPPPGIDQASNAPKIDNAFIDAPGAVNQFDCFLVNISGEGVPSTLSATGHGDKQNQEDKLCHSPGLPSLGSIYGSADIESGSTEVEIPNGKSRTIQLIAFKSAGGCPSIFDMIDDEKSKGLNKFGDGFEIGRTTIDVNSTDGQDITVPIKISYNPGDAKRVFCGPEHDKKDSSSLVKKQAGHLEFTDAPWSVTQGQPMSESIYLGYYDQDWNPIYAKAKVKLSVVSGPGFLDGKTEVAGEFGYAYFEPFSLKLSQPGEVRLKAEATFEDGKVLSTVSYPIWVYAPHEAVHFAVDALTNPADETTVLSTSNSVGAGTSFYLRIKALDANGQLITDYDGDIEFYSNDPLLDMGPSITIGPRGIYQGSFDPSMGGQMLINAVALRTAGNAQYIGVMESGFTDSYSDTVDILVTPGTASAIDFDGYVNLGGVIKGVSVGSIPLRVIDGYGNSVAQTSQYIYVYGEYSDDYQNWGSSVSYSGNNYCVTDSFGKCALTGFIINESNHIFYRLKFILGSYAPLYTDAFNVSSDRADSMTITGLSASVTKKSCLPAQVVFQGGPNGTVGASGPTSLTLTATGTGVVLYLDNNCTAGNQITSPIGLNPSTTSTAFYVLFDQATTGAGITASALGGASGTFYAYFNGITVTPLPLSHLDLTATSPQVVPSPAETIATKDAYYEGIANYNVSSFALYSDSNCSTMISGSQQSNFNTNASGTINITAFHTKSESVYAKASAMNGATQIDSSCVMINLSAGTVSRLVLHDANPGQAKTIGGCWGFTIGSEDNYGNPQTVASAKTITLNALLNATSLPVWYSDAGCTTAISNTSISANAWSTVTVYFSSDAHGSFNLGAVDSTGGTPLTSGNLSISLNRNFTRSDLFAGSYTQTATASVTNGTLRSAARFFNITSIIANDDYVFVGDSGNGSSYFPAIYRISIANRGVTKLWQATGYGCTSFASQSTGIIGMALNSAGDLYYIDSKYEIDGSTYGDSCHRIGLISNAGNCTPGTNCNPSLVAGSNTGSYGGANGNSTAALFKFPKALTIIGGATGQLYVADWQNSSIRKVDLSLSPSNTNYVTTFSGVNGSIGYVEGSSTNARFYYPSSLVNDGSNLYVTESNTTCLRRVDSSGSTTYLGGAPGSASIYNCNRSLTDQSQVTTGAFDASAYVGGDALLKDSLDGKIYLTTNLYMFGNASAIRSVDPTSSFDSSSFFSEKSVSGASRAAPSGDRTDGPITTGGGSVDVNRDAARFRSLTSNQSGMFFVESYCSTLTSCNNATAIRWIH